MRRVAAHSSQSRREPLRSIAHVTPQVWAIDGFRALAFDGAGLVQIAPQIGVLVVFAAVPLALAALRFRCSLTA